jgi:hypothetical protein
MGVRPVRIDERGRIFELSGERFSLPGLEPADVLAGLADAQAGRIRSLKAIREGRAGRRRPGGPTARESAPGVCNSTRLDWAPRSGVGRPMNYRRSDPHRHRGDNRGVLKPSLSGGGRGRRDRSGVEAPHPRPALTRGVACGFDRRGQRRSMESRRAHNATSSIVFTATSRVGERLPCASGAFA